MRFTISFLLFVFTLSACVSSTKLLQQGNYDAAIDKSVKKLMKNPTNEKQVEVLDRAYKLANERDNNVIRELKFSGQPDIWNDVYSRYSRLRIRQDKVARLPKDVLDRIGFRKIDYHKEVADAKNKAAAFYYANGEKLLKENDKFSARKAYEQFLFIKKHFSNYRDVDQKINEAIYLGTNRVVFSIRNNARVALPDDFESEIRKISLSSLDARWLEFHSNMNNNIDYDYTIILNLRHIEVSPQLLEKEKYTDSKKVNDGWEYILDSRGNVMKDSLGNDIKRTKYKEIKAYINLFKMDKRATVEASLDYYDNNLNRLLKSVPIRTEFRFDYQYAIYNGEEKALSKESRKLVKRKPATFPTDLQMIFDTNNELKRIAYETVKRDRNMFLN